MAIWQIPFFILPEESLRDFPFIDDEGIFDDSPYWLERNVTKSFFNHINSFLPQGESWSEQVIVYGNNQSHDVQIYLDVPTQKIISVSLRIDFTHDYHWLIKSIIAFCIDNKLTIISAENLDKVPLNIETITNLIKNSSQVKKYNMLREQ